MPFFAGKTHIFDKQGARLLLKSYHKRGDPAKDLYVHPWDLSKVFRVDQWEGEAADEAKAVLQIFDASST